ncbi:hypothetical protein HELRODRAFT_165914 [Helobdella robusta]|uniref:Uncharacterized protein n=1 Tax=Helobdella robusta TaxID=6412 RepID=T1EXG0_HELRO|nr:hypothetical protein HELRODRAFT_165914 [Helobdella robusta]ESN90271.1 hypothetical protein HELRODRAFT_165914 [Helobdella robusta]
MTDLPREEGTFAGRHINSISQAPSITSLTQNNYFSNYANLFRPIQQDTTRYNKIQQDTTRYNKIPQDTTRYNKIQQDTTRYNKIPQDTTRYNKIPQDTTRYNSLQRQPAMFNDIETLIRILRNMKQQQDRNLVQTASGACKYGE